MFSSLKQQKLGNFIPIKLQHKALNGNSGENKQIDKKAYVDFHFIKREKWGKGEKKGENHTDTEQNFCSKQLVNNQGVCVHVCQAMPNLAI